MARKAAPRSGKRARARIPYRVSEAQREGEDRAARAIAKAFSARLARQRDAAARLVAPIARELGRPEGAEKSIGLDRDERLAKARRTLTDRQVLDAIAEALAPQIQASLRSAAESGGQARGDALGFRFLDRDPAISDFLRDRETNLERVVDGDTATMVKETIARGVDAGETEKQLMDRILRTDSEIFGKARAQRIARTEAHIAAMAGDHQAMRQAGIARRQWLSAPDARETHREANGEIRAIDEPFQVGDAELMFPGDPDGGADHPEEVINCRCVLLTLDDAEATTAEEVAERLDPDGDEEAAEAILEAAEGLPDEVVARIDPDDLDDLEAADGEGDQVDYDAEDGVLTVGPDADEEDVQAGVLQHMVSSLMTRADARGVMNQLRLYDLPEPPKEVGSELDRASKLVARTVVGDRAGAEDLLDDSLDGDEWETLRAIAQQFWISPASGAPAAAERTRKAFDPDQARDESGRWTSGGGGGIRAFANVSTFTSRLPGVSVRQDTSGTYHVDWEGMKATITPAGGTGKYSVRVERADGTVAEAEVSGKRSDHALSKATTFMRAVKDGKMTGTGTSGGRAGGAGTGAESKTTPAEVVPPPPPPAGEAAAGAGATSRQYAPATPANYSASTLDTMEDGYAFRNSGEFGHARIGIAAAIKLSESASVTVSLKNSTPEQKKVYEKQVRDAVARTVEEMSRYVAPEILEGLVKQVNFKVKTEGAFGTQRAYYQGGFVDQHIALPAQTVPGHAGLKETLAHEMGHAFEDEIINNDRMQKSIRFYNERTEGERPIALSVAKQGGRYKPHEMTKPDKFIDPYMGYDYHGRASEVMSMVMERLVDGLSGSSRSKMQELKRRDPDMYYFALGQLNPRRK